MKTGIELITAERRRQIEEEEFDAEHDDDHDAHELAWAAVCYAAPDRVFMVEKHTYWMRWFDPWPGVWSTEWDKRPRDDESGEVIGDSKIYSHETRVDFLTKAGALIAAEIDRLNRAKEAAEDECTSSEK